MKLRQDFTAFMRDESGATAIEYAMILALIFLAIVVSVSNVSTALNENYYDNIADTFSDL